MMNNSPKRRFRRCDPERAKLVEALKKPAATEFFDQVKTFNDSCAWIYRQAARIQRRKLTPRAMRQLQELRARNQQLGREIKRFMEA